MPISNYNIFFKLCKILRYIPILLYPAVSLVIILGFILSIQYSLINIPSSIPIIKIGRVLLITSINIISYFIFSTLLKRKWLANVFISFIFSISLCFLQLIELGDKHFLANYLIPADRIWLAEMGSLFIYTIAYKLHIMPFISPVFGGITCFVILHKSVELEKLNNWQGRPIAFFLFFSFLTSPIIYLFSFDYIEMTQPSLPFLIYGTITLASYIKGHRKYFPGALGLIIACFFHGMNCFLLPLLFIAPFLKSLEKKIIFTMIYYFFGRMSLFYGSFYY